jgi:serine/arginine repetitive matrix protein 1
LVSYRVDRPGTRERRTSFSPVFRGSKSPPKPPIASRRPTGFGDRGISHEIDERRAGTERDGKSSAGDKRAFGDKDERKTAAPIREARDVVGEKRLYSDTEDRKTGSDRGFREKKDRWAHSDLNDEEEPQRGGRDVVGEKRLYSDMDNRRAGFDRPVRETREKWAHNDSNEGQKETTRAVTGVPGEKRPQSEIERNTGVGRVGRDNSVEDRYDIDNGRRVEDRSGKDGGSGKREIDARKSAVEKEDRYFSDRRDRPAGRQRSPLPERQQAFKDTRGVRKTVDSSQSPVRERREEHGRRSIELDNDDSDVVRENLSKKSRIQEAEDGGLVREDDQESLSPRGSDERRKEEQRRRKEEKRLRKEERHKRKREEKQKRKDEKRAMKASTMNGEEKRNRALSPDGMEQSDEEHSEYDQKQKRKEEKRALKTGAMNGEDKRNRALRSPDAMEQSDEEHSEYDQKQLEDTLRQKALESMRAMKAISH